VAEHLLKLPIFYVEYSGTYGSPDALAAVRQVLNTTKLWYGGGIREPAQAAEMAALADAIVIGNVVYDVGSPFG
jgi:putative glycerol-1-phosphate prenyltransferase